MKGLLQTLKNIFKIEELRSRIYVTLGFFNLRICAFVTLPGVNRDALQILLSKAKRTFRYFDLFTGGFLTIFNYGFKNNVNLLQL